MRRTYVLRRVAGVSEPRHAGARSRSPESAAADEGPQRRPREIGLCTFTIWTVIAGLVGVSIAAGASLAGYAAMAPGSQLFGRTLVRGADRRQLALTYDDGPNDPHTMRLLEVLARRQARATFFLIGRFVKQRPEIVRAIAQAGHAIGNHTYSHPSLVFCSPARVRAEMQDAERALQDALGQTADRLFRPPFGARRPDVLRAARAMNLQPVLWSASGYDWRLTTSEKVEQRLIRQISGGEVILLHDGGHLAMGADRAHTVAASERIVARYQAEGYRFVTVPEMMRTT